MPVRQVIYKFNGTRRESSLPNGERTVSLEGWKIPFMVQDEGIVLDPAKIERGSDLVDIQIRQQERGKFAFLTPDEIGESKFQIAAEIIGLQERALLLSLVDKRRGGFQPEDTQSIHIERTK